jgi:glycosyltransferase involved in cell wall biosynthesis
LPSQRRQPVRVLFVNTRSALGADVAVHLTLIKNLDPERCEVTLATNCRAVDLDKTLRTVEGTPGLSVVALNLGYELTGRTKARKLLGAVGNALAMALGLVRLAALVYRRRVDVIHSTDRPRDALLATLLARLTGRKNVLHLHIKWYPGMGRATTWALRKCDAVLAISQFVRRSLIEGGVPDGKIYTAHNATDPVEFDPSQQSGGFLRDTFGLAQEVPIIGMVARIMVWKGHLELVEALARVREQFPSVRLVIVGKEDTWLGGESYGSQVRARINELGLQDNVIWAGWFDDTAKVFADLDLVCVPSWEEPFGLVVTEAMAMERPVAGFNSGALPEIICSGREGILVPAKDTEALADAIIQLLSVPALRRRMGRQGRARVLEAFTPGKQAGNVITIYEDILAGRPQSAWTE